MLSHQRASLAFYDLQRLYRTLSDNTPIQLIDALVDILCDKFISKENRQLLQIAFCPELEQATLDAFMSCWDIEKMTSDKALLLAYVMKKRPDLDFGAYNGPRLKGLLSYYRFQNLNLISHFSKIVTALNKKNIVPMILKGGAMKYLCPDLPRAMGDIDILVDSPKSYNLAKETVKELGYTYNEEPHSIDVHLRSDPDKGILDIHQFLGFDFCSHPLFIKDVFQRAKINNIFKAETYLPTHEDLFFICLNNISQNIKISTSIQGLPFAFFDLFYLSNTKKHFDWNIVFHNIFAINANVQSYIAAKFINKIIPDFIPQPFFENKKIISNVCNAIYMDKFYTLYVHDVKLACKKLKIKEALKNKDSLKTYVKFKTQHFFTKRIVKSPLLSKLFLRLLQKGV